jgi:hypothetical protein
MPPEADSIEIAIQNVSAAMDADPTLKGTDAAKQYNAIYQRLRVQGLLKWLRQVGVILGCYRSLSIRRMAAGLI